MIHFIRLALIQSLQQTQKLWFLSPIVAAVLWGLSGSAKAVGITLTEVGASGLGNAYAGATAEANDAGVMYFNPAALTRFKRAEQIFSAVAIQSKAAFEDSAQGSNGYPAGGQRYERDPSYGFAPSNFVAIPVNDKLVLGVGVSGSAGLILRYPNDYPGRFQSTSTDIKVTRVNGGFGYKVSPSLSVGANVSVERFFESIRVNVDYAQAAAAEGGVNGALGGLLTNPLLNGVFFDGLGNNRAVGLKLKMYGTQVNAQWGALFEPNDNTRIGLSYRPKTRFDLEGRFQFQQEHPALLLAAAPQLLADGRVTSQITTPSELRMSVFHRLNKSFDMMADIFRLDYSSIQNIEYRRTDGSVLKSYIQDLKAGHRYAVGVNHRIYQRLMLRYGYSYDEAVSSSQYRVTALPDQARNNFNVGMQLQISPTDYLDFGLQYTLFKDAAIQDRAALQGRPGEKSYDGNLNGAVKSKLMFLGLQYRSAF